MAGYQGFAHGAYLVATSRSWVDELVVLFTGIIVNSGEGKTQKPQKKC